MLSPSRKAALLDFKMTDTEASDGTYLNDVRAWPSRKRDEIYPLASLVNVAHREFGEPMFCADMNLKDSRVHVSIKEDEYHRSLPELSWPCAHDVLQAQNHI